MMLAFLVCRRPEGLGISPVLSYSIACDYYNLLTQQGLYFIPL